MLTIDDFYLHDVNELSSLISSTSNSITSNTLVAYDLVWTGNTLNDLSLIPDGTITAGMDIKVLQMELHLVQRILQLILLLLQMPMDVLHLTRYVTVNNCQQ